MPKPFPKALSPRQLREATKLRGRIDALRQKLHAILGDEQGRTTRKGKRAPSAANRAKVRDKITSARAAKSSRR